MDEKLKYSKFKDDIRTELSIFSSFEDKINYLIDLQNDLKKLRINFLWMKSCFQITIATIFGFLLLDLPFWLLTWLPPLSQDSLCIFT